MLFLVLLDKWIEEDEPSSNSCSSSEAGILSCLRGRDLRPMQTIDLPRVSEGTYCHSGSQCHNLWTNHERVEIAT